MRVDWSYWTVFDVFYTFLRHLTTKRLEPRPYYWFVKYHSLLAVKWKAISIIFAVHTIQQKEVTSAVRPLIQTPYNFNCRVTRKHHLLMEYVNILALFEASPIINRQSTQYTYLKWNMGAFWMLRMVYSHHKAY